MEKPGFGTFRMREPFLAPIEADYDCYNHIIIKKAALAVPKKSREVLTMMKAAQLEWA